MDVLKKVVSSIDFNQVLFGENGVSSEMGEYSQLIEGITQTDMMEDLLDLYVKDVMGTL